MKKINFNVSLPVSIFKEGKTYIAFTPVLDLSTSASTYKKAQKRFAEAVELFFEELTEMGTTDKVLSGLGWQKVKSEWSPPLQIDHSLQSYSVPLAA